MASKSSYRITKYNPKSRDDYGAYQKHEWVSASDVGMQFPDGKLSLNDYLKTEGAYVDAAICLWKLAQCPPLRVVGLEDVGFRKTELALKDYPELLKVVSEAPVPKEDQMLCDQETIERTARLVLREFIWCKLQADNGFFVHFGWDYYMYCGGVQMTTQTRSDITELGIFVEDFVSPYLSAVW